MTATHERILARLRGPDDHLERLVALALDHLLDRPVAAIIDPAWLARALSQGMRASAASEQFEVWVAQRIEQAIARADRLQGTLGDELPITVLDPLQKALARPYRPDRELVEALFDHPSTRAILREILQANLLEFAKRMRSIVPDVGRAPTGSGGFASKLAGMAKGVAAAVGSELEKQLEPRVEGFVDDILGVAVRMLIDRVGSEEFAPEFAKWRVDVLLAVLALPIERLVVGQGRPRAELAADVAAILRALASWRGLGERIEVALGELIAEHGQETAREFLDGSGLEQAWRPMLEQAVTEQARQWVETEGFSNWLRVLVED